MKRCCCSTIAEQEAAGSDFNVIVVDVTSGSNRCRRADRGWHYTETKTPWLDVDDGVDCGAVPVDADSDADADRRTRVSGGWRCGVQSRSLLVVVVLSAGVFLQRAQSDRLLLAARPQRRSRRHRRQQSAAQSERKRLRVVHSTSRKLFRAFVTRTSLSQRVRHWAARGKSMNTVCSFYLCRLSV